MKNKPNIKILLVDNEEDNLDSMELVLARDDYQLKKALSGKDALKILLQDNDFTLILMAVQMPGLNGIETASMIYENRQLKHIPIIFIATNAPCRESFLKGYKTGGVGYLYKPIDEDILRAKVTVFADLYRNNHFLMENKQKLKKNNVALEESVRQKTEELLIKNIELEEMNVQLKKVNNDLDSFVYTASHDLKAPVSNIEGLLSTLIDSLGEKVTNDKDINIILEMIKKSIVRFKLTIEDLTYITKIQKKLEQDIEDLNLIEVIEGVKNNISELITKNNAKIIVSVQDCLKIKFSRNNFYSIFSNLISNAIKYKSPQRNPEIKIKKEIQNGVTMITVSDNGLGFNPKDKDKIFTMFKRLHDHVEGSGVGLYIVKRIMENCGGKIEVDTIPDEGSVFRLYFNAN